MYLWASYNSKKKKSTTLRPLYIQIIRKGIIKAQEKTEHHSQAPSSSYPWKPSFTVFENSKKELHWSKVTRVFSGHCCRNSTNSSV